MTGTETFLLGALAFFLPPVPVFLLDKTIFTKEFLVSVLLTFLGHVPGVIFSLYYILVEHPRRGFTSLDEENRTENGRNTSGNRLGGNVDSQRRYTDNPDHSQMGTEEQGQEQGQVKAQEPRQEAGQEPDQDLSAQVEGSSDAPPPDYDEVVPQEQQLKQEETDSKRDNKIQH